MPKHAQCARFGGETGECSEKRQSRQGVIVGSDFVWEAGSDLYGEKIGLLVVEALFKLA